MNLSRKLRFTDEDLWQIISKHRQALTSVGGWNQYAKEHGLPHSQTLIQRLGSWNLIKERLNIQLNEQHRPRKYEEKELLEVLKKHRDQYTNIYNWNMYAKQHKLPTHGVFERYLGLERLEELTGFKSEYTKKDLKKIILEHFPEKPPTVNDWKGVSKDKNLPSFTTIIRRFGSWNTMKAHVYR